jgi:uncharacterized membrane protein YkvA (DUF1232 family)
MRGLGRSDEPRCDRQDVVFLDFNAAIGCITRVALGAKKLDHLDWFNVYKLWQRSCRRMVRWLTERGIRFMTPSLLAAASVPYLAHSQERRMSFEFTASLDDGDLARERNRVRRGFWSKFKRVAAQIPFAEDLLTAYYCAFDRETPREVQAALIGALAYFVLPFDVIPDILPVIGYTDDAAVLAIAIRLVAKHIRPQHREAARRALARAGAA